MRVFIPGRLTNPLNGSYGHWDKHRRWAKDWRERTQMHLLAAGVSRRYDGQAKRVEFTAHVLRLWDDDNLPAGLKPVRDALVDMRVLDSDAPTAGHEFVYRQCMDRSHPGVEIIVDVLAALR